MATICEQADLILEHPYFGHCLDLAKNGDNSEFKRLLYEVMASTWEKCSLSASRLYGNWHRGNHMLIKKELREMEPPTTLDFRLPIPPPKEKPQIIIPITRNKHKHRLTDPNQLLIPFPEARILHLKTA